MQAVVDYLMKTYAPSAIVVYGSYQNGTNDEYSDFDCLAVVKKKSKRHDGSVVNGVRLDCFLYTEKEIAEERACKLGREDPRDRSFSERRRTRVR